MTQHTILLDDDKLNKALTGNSWGTAVRRWRSQKTKDLIANPPKLKDKVWMAMDDYDDESGVHQVKVVAYCPEMVKLNLLCNIAVRLKNKNVHSCSISAICRTRQDAIIDYLLYYNCITKIAACNRWIQQTLPELGREDGALAADYKKKLQKARQEIKMWLTQLPDDFKFPKPLTIFNRKS